MGGAVEDMVGAGASAEKLEYITCNPAAEPTAGVLLGIVHGLWRTRTCCILCTPRLKTDFWQVVASFKKLTGRDPELVVFASNYWDIASWTNRNANVFDRDDLEDWAIDEFQTNMSHVLSTIEVSRPPTYSQFCLGAVRLENAPWHLS